MQPLPVLHDYDLLQCLGGGPLTEVFSARHCASDARCAVKLLRDEWAGDPTAIKLLQREARAGFAVRHPHLVRVLDAHVTCAPFFLVMELLAGESLRTRLRRDYALDLRTAFWVARQTAEALVALHRAGFIHGDVKPDNVRIVDVGRAVLVDLGFAHRPGENAGFIGAGYVLGTVDYLAPELCGPGPAAAAASDWFGFGLTLCEMLTGQLPYPTGTASETIERHRQDSVGDWLQRRAFEWPPRLAALLEGLLEREPSARPLGPMVVHELIALEIAALGWKRSA
jgi:serine/threonine protein kinase